MSDSGQRTGHPGLSSRLIDELKDRWGEEAAQEINRLEAELAQWQAATGCSSPDECARRLDAVIAKIQAQTAKVQAQTAKIEAMHGRLCDS